MSAGRLVQRVLAKETKKFGVLLLKADAPMAIRVKREYQTVRQVSRRRFVENIAFPGVVSHFSKALGAAHSVNLLSCAAAAQTRRESEDRTTLPAARPPPLQPENRPLLPS